MNTPIFRIVWLLALGEVAVAGEVRIPHRDWREAPSGTYRVEAEGKAVFVGRFSDVSVARFSMAGPVAVEVRAGAPVRSFNVSPHSAGIAAKASGETLAFTLDRPRRLVVTINDAEKLLLFAEAMDEPKFASTGVVDVGTLGVDRLGRTIETKRLQAAIDRAAANGGTLYFPPGVYLTGTLRLRSDLTLFLAEGARLQGSADPDDYPVDPGWNETELTTDNARLVKMGRADASYRRLLQIENVRNVRIAGRGTIDGQGNLLRWKKNVTCILVRDSSDVAIEDVTLLDSALYNIHAVNSDRIAFRRLKLISNRNVHNTDGIDPDSCRDVAIEDCFFHTADDCISPKTSGQSGTRADQERLVVRNCVFLTKTSAIKIGNETFAGSQRDMLFENLDVLECDRALTVSALDGHVYRNFRFVDVRVEKLSPTGRRFPIQVHVRTRMPGSPAAQIRDILFRNIAIEEDHPERSRLSGISAEGDVKGVRFENYVVAGKVRRNATEAKLEIGEFVSDVSFEK